jgi:hypothetical protein
MNNCEEHEFDVPPGCPGCILHALKNLLAVIHGDGGHHTEWVGILQSCKDAMEKVSQKV